MYLPQMELPLGWLYHKGRLEDAIQKLSENSPHKIRQIASLQEELKMIDSAFGDDEGYFTFKKGKQNMWVTVVDGFLFYIAQQEQGLGSGSYEVWNADVPGSQRRLRYLMLWEAYSAAGGMYADNAYVIGQTWCQLIKDEFGFNVEVFLDPTTHMLVFTVITKTMPVDGSPDKYHRILTSEIFQYPVPLKAQDLNDMLQEIRDAA